mgnify:FL=1
MGAFSAVVYLRLRTQVSSGRLPFSFILRPGARCPQLLATPSLMDPFALFATPPGPPGAPAPPPATIRPFKATDLKVVRYIVGSGIMEPSSRANQAALLRPFPLVLLALLIQLMITRLGRGWPDSVQLCLGGNAAQYLAEWHAGDWAKGVVQWVSILPSFVGPPIALLALFELRHRNLFEEEMTRAIGAADMRDIEGYYETEKLADADGKVASRKGSKVVAEGGRQGFWVLEYDGRILGALGLDGRNAGKELDSISDLPPHSREVGAPNSTSSALSTSSTLRNRATVPSSTPPALSTRSTVQLRRFATSLSFRAAGIESELLAHATSFAFSPSSSPTPAAERLTIAVRPTVERGLVVELRAAGFKDVPVGSALEIEVDGWKNGKETWYSKVLGVCWPLDLGWRTLVLERKEWEALREQK